MENLEIMLLLRICSHIGTVVHWIIDLDRRKRRMNLGICKQNANNPRIRSSCCRILTPPAEFDTSRRNHWRCLRRLSSTHLCWSCFGAGCRGNVLFLSTGLQQQSVVECRIWHEVQIARSNYSRRALRTLIVRQFWVAGVHRLQEWLWQRLQQEHSLNFKLHDLEACCRRSTSDLKNTDHRGCKEDLQDLAEAGFKHIYTRRSRRRE
jgi:hypothetical protein